MLILPRMPAARPEAVPGCAGRALPLRWRAATARDWVQGIALDPSNPGPLAVDTPTTYSPGQLPGAPAPVYITPIDFTISTP